MGIHGLKCGIHGVANVCGELPQRRYFHFMAGRGGVTLRRTEHTHIIITSAQKVDNVILTQVQVNFCAGPSIIGVIKTTGNIVIHFPCVFCVGSGHNQSYDLECDWESLSPFSTQKVKGRTSE